MAHEQIEVTQGDEDAALAYLGWETPDGDPDAVRELAEAFARHRAPDPRLPILEAQAAKLAEALAFYMIDCTNEECEYCICARAALAGYQGDAK